MRLFLVPAQLASGGISGLSQIINYYTGLPIGMMVLLGNIPFLLFGWRYLGGPRFSLRTAFAVVSFPIFVDVLNPYLPQDGLTEDIVLNTLYVAVVSGNGFGFVHRDRETTGGSDILGRILNHKWGIPISQSYLITDALVKFFAGLSFSLGNVLFSLVMLYISGIVAETITQASSVVRTALIITAYLQEVKSKILLGLGRWITEISGKGGYTGTERLLLYCVITRSEATRLKSLVSEVDPKAFMVIGQAHEALGEGFHPLKE